MMQRPFLQRQQEITDRRLEYYPELTWVYPGLTPDKISQLPQIIKEKYIEKIPEMMERWQIMLCNASSFPYMDVQGRKQLQHMWDPPRPLEADIPVKLITKDEYLRQFQVSGIRMQIEEVELPPGAFDGWARPNLAED